MSNFGRITRLKDKKGTGFIYPVTSSNAVVMKDGKDLQGTVDNLKLTGGADLTKLETNIIPAVSGLEIGSPENRFKSIYVDEAYLSTNTLYLGDTPVMGTDSDTIMIRSDKDQSINMRTTGVGSSKIISESNVELSTSGPNADVIVQAKGQGSRAVLSAENAVEMNAKQVKIAAETILEGATRAKSLTVDGNLVVNGDAFTVNTTTVTTKDNIIEINKGQVGSGVSAGQAGLRVDRGDAEDFLMVFDETDDRFKVGTANGLQTLATNVYVNDEINKNKHTHSNKDVLDQFGKDVNGKLTFAGGIVKGDKGDIGPQGLKGDTGLAGPQGPAGATGAKGADGLTTSILVNGTTYTHSGGKITLPNYPSSLPANGGNADTVDGKHASDFRASNWVPTASEVGAIAKNTENILNNSSFGVGFLASADSGSPWVAGYFGKNGGKNQVVVGELSETATIGAHNAAKNSWAELYVNNQKGVNSDPVKNKTVIAYPYAKEGSTEHRVYHTGYKPTAADIGAATSSHGHDKITSSLSTGTYLAGNQGTAIINSTAAGTGYNMIIKANSANGVWTMGSWGSNFKLFYTAKSTVDAGINEFTKELNLLNENGNSYFPGAVCASSVRVGGESVRMEFNSSTNSLDFIFA